MRHVAWRAALAMVAAAVVSLGSGCVAFNVGKPEVFTHTETVVTTNRTPLKTEVLSVEPKAQVEGNRLNAWLDVDVREEYARSQHKETVTVKKQRRLALGFCPGWARDFIVPKGALDHDRWASAHDVVKYGTNDYAFLSFSRNNPEGAVIIYPRESLGKMIYLAFCVDLFSLGVAPVAGTVDTLLVEPLSGSGWSLGHHFLDAENGRKVLVPVKKIATPNSIRIWVDKNNPDYELERLDVSGTPKIQALGRFSPQERKQMGILTCFDLKEGGEKVFSFRSWGKLGLFGFYKYNDMFVEPIVSSPLRAMENGTKRETRAVEGPYEVNLRISGTGIESKTSVGAGSSKATFALPQVERGGAYEATLVFQSLYTGTKDDVRKSWKAKVLKTTVWLAEKPKPAPVAVYTLQTQPVREVHHYHETRVVEERKPEGAPWDIETVEPFQDGRAVYLVTIRDASKKAFEVEREVRPDIERNLREAFMASMPGMDEKSVAVTVVAEYEGRAIRFRGAAFSAVPLPDSWEYNADTRRGMVRLQINGGMTIPDMERWARENIDAIASSQNVALEAGKESPAGAKYRFLDKEFHSETKVLTVEFEAVE